MTPCPRSNCSVSVLSCLQQLDSSARQNSLRIPRRDRLDGYSQGPMDKIERLRERIAELESERAFNGRSYPEGLTGFPGVLTGQGFFPGGDGLWRTIPSSTDKPPFPIGGITILGNDFGCEDNSDPKNLGFIQCLDRGFEDPPTWSINETLRKSDIPGECCFFTNSYLGLRTKTDPAKPCKSTGPSPGAQNSRFTRMCRAFLAFQIETQRPRMIICLGHEPRTFVAPVLLPRKHAWNRKNLSFPQLDLECDQVLSASIRLTGGDVLTALLVVIAHPSFAFATHSKPASMRTFEGHSGEAAELSLLRKAWQAAQQIDVVRP